MVCDTKTDRDQSPEERMKEVGAALKKLGDMLKQGSVTVAIDRMTGALALRGWNDNDRAGLSDACTYRLMAQTWEMRQAVARAEALAGRKVSQVAIASGRHSHDGGATWHPGH